METPACDHINAVVNLTQYITNGQKGTMQG